MIKAIHTKVKGRARYKVNKLYGSLLLQKYLERSLGNNPEIIYVYANSLTSNILVIFTNKYSFQGIGLLLETTLRKFQEKSSLTQTESWLNNQRLVINDAKQKNTDNWHLITADRVIDRLNSAKISGLSSESAIANLTKYGRNVLTAIPTRSPSNIFIDQFKSLTVALLL